MQRGSLSNSITINKSSGSYPEASVGRTLVPSNVAGETADGVAELMVVGFLQNDLMDLMASSRAIPTQPTTEQSIY